MRKAKEYPHVTKQIYHAELTTCLSCGARLRRYASVFQRTVITLDGVVRVVHYSGPRNLHTYEVRVR